MIDPDSFRDAMRVWATGIAVITAQTPAERHGMTVNSFTSVSLDPPLVLVCIQNNLRILSLIQSSGVFALSVLRADQSEWSQHFATPSTEVIDRLAGYETFTAATGAPILKGALGYFDCQVETYHAGGTHTIIVARVLDAKREEGEPLVYWNRDYRGIQLAPKANENLKEAFATWSHDSRAGLNSVLGFARVLLNGMDGALSEVQRSDIEAIWRGGIAALHILSRANTFLRLWSRRDNFRGDGELSLSGLVKSIHHHLNGKIDLPLLSVSLPDEDYHFGNLQVADAIIDIIDPASHAVMLEKCCDPAVEVSHKQAETLHFRLAPGLAPQHNVDRVKQEYSSLKFTAGSPLDVARLVIQAVGRNLVVSFGDEGVVFDFDLPAWRETAGTTPKKS